LIVSDRARDRGNKFDDRLNATTQQLSSSTLFIRESAVKPVIENTGID
jgi:hypothetical protein